MALNNPHVMISSKSQDTIRSALFETTKASPKKKKGIVLGPRTVDLSKPNSRSKGSGSTSGTDQMLTRLRQIHFTKTKRLAEDDAQLAFLKEEMDMLEAKKAALIIKHDENVAMRSELRASIAHTTTTMNTAIAEMRGTTKNSMLSNEKVTKHNTIFENQMKKGYDGRGAQVGMPKGRARAQFGGAGVPPTRSFYDPNEPDPKRGLPYTGKKPWSVPGTSGAHLSQFAKKK